MSGTTSTKRKAGTKKTAFPFPFLGQGDAGYYEWFEMWVWFEAPVPKAKRAALLDRGPPPCLHDAQWPSPELLWPSTGDQWIHRHLIEAYGTPAAKKRFAKAQARMDAGDNDDDDLDDLLAGREQTVFNEAIERWLLAMHAKCRILFAVRGQDAEAGGTKLGEWHAASVVSFSDRVLPKLEELSKSKLGKDDLRRTPITFALNYVGPDRFAPAIRRLANEKELTKATSADAKAEDEALGEMSIAFTSKKFTEAVTHAKKLVSPAGRLRALVSLTDDAFCMGVSLVPSGAHALVVSMIDALGGQKLSVVRALPIAKKELSLHLVCAAYAGSLEAAAWANDQRSFDAVARLVDETPGALRSYILRSAEALSAKRPDFAARMRDVAKKPAKR